MKTFDSWAWVEYFQGSRAGKLVRDYVEGDEVLSTPSLCLAEIKVKYLAEGKDPSDRLQFIKARTSIIDVDAAVAEDAADVKVQLKLHLVDALVLACARKMGGDLVTGDKHFQGVSGVVMLAS